ncbi:MAG: hypothetical protein PHI79_02695, partial [Sulfurovaceae bacterium]|nr:hypothetical protein [Sulfurovaceae bacterium]
MLQLVVNNQIINIAGDGKTHKTLRIQTHVGDKIVIQDDTIKHSPIKLHTKKIDNDLYIFEENTQDPS